MSRERQNGSKLGDRRVSISGQDWYPDHFEFFLRGSLHSPSSASRRSAVISTSHTARWFAYRPVRLKNRCFSQTCKNLQAFEPLITDAICVLDLHSSYRRQQNITYRTFAGIVVLSRLVSTADQILSLSIYNRVGVKISNHGKLRLVGLQVGGS